MATKRETLPVPSGPRVTQELPSVEALNAIILKGDWSLLSTEEQRYHYIQLCNALGLRYTTQPFLFLDTKDSRTILYATRACTDQLRQLYCLSSKITKRERDSNAKTYLVEVKIWDPFGREDFATGVVSLVDKDGDPLSPMEMANAPMKAETKAKRRATLSWCGLGILDESELDTVRARRNSSASVLAELTRPADAKQVAEVRALLENKKILPAQFTELTGKAQPEELTVFQAQQLLAEATR